MCTVTYLPFKDGSGDFVLTSNRDEKTARPSAIMPQIYALSGKRVIFPKDPQGMGTWIAASEFGTVVCLLNGAFVPHIPKPLYKHSRGLVVTDFFSFSAVQEFYRDYDFLGIEPFTLVIVENGSLSELRWDGTLASHTYLDAAKPHIWSSVTLYTTETMAKRKVWFHAWVEAGNSPESIVDFHTFGGEGEVENDILMNRKDFLRTVSISSIKKTEESIRFQYIDLKTQQKYGMEMSLEGVHE